MNQKSIKPGRGKVLISDPILIDSYFNRSVVLLIEHNKEGAFGIILNKPIKIKLNNIITGFPNFDAKIYMGGPVKTDSLFVMHTLGNIVENSFEFAEGLFWGGDIDTIIKLVSAKVIKAEDIRFFVGYCGWEANQLEKELKENSWLVALPNVEEIITNKPDKMWQNFMKNMGEEYAIWSNFPANPFLN